MSNSCAGIHNPYPDSCRVIADSLRGSLRRRKLHGRKVSDISSKYFETIARRVKPEPELSLAFALTVSLAHIHHLRGGGNDLDGRERVIRSLKKKIAQVPGFRQELGVTQDEFLSQLEKCFNQYATLSSNSYDYNPDARLPNYAALILSGGASLPALIVKIADYCLDEADWAEGLPANEEVTPATKKMLSNKMRKVFFPLAEMFGWMGAAYMLRESSLNWDPELQDKLAEMKLRMQPIIPAYSHAAPYLNDLVAEAFSIGCREGMPLQGFQGIIGQAVFHHPRVKSEASIVLKMEDRGKEFDEIMDMIATRVILPCDPGMVFEMGQLLYEKVLKDENFRFRTHDFNDYVNHPKDSGYTAIHITGYMPFLGVLVPCEIQLMDFMSYLDSCCGRSSRLGYKGNESMEKLNLINAMNEMLRPVSAAAADVRGAIEVPQQKTNGGNGRRTYSVHMPGRKSRRPIEASPNATVADIAFAAMGGPYNADIYGGKEPNGRKISLLAQCPDEIFVSGNSSFISRKMAKDLCRNPLVDNNTKKMIRGRVN